MERAATEKARVLKEREITMAKENKNTSLVKYEDYSEEEAVHDEEEIGKARGPKTLVSLKEGKTRIRFIPALAGKKFNPPKGTLGGMARVTYEHWVSVPGLGDVRFTCPLFEAKKKCRACDMEKKLRASSSEVDQKRADKFKAGRRIYSNIILRSEEESGPRVLPFGIQVEKQLVEMRKDEDLGGNFVHPVQGFDIIIVKSGSGFETRYKVVPADKGASSPLSDDAKQMNEWIAGQNDLEKYVKVYSDEDIQRILNGEKPDAWGGPSRTGRNINDEVDPDSDDEDEEEDD